MFLYDRLREGYFPVLSGMSIIMVPVHPEAVVEKGVAQLICLAAQFICSLLLVFLLNSMFFSLLPEYKTYRQRDSASSL